MGLTHYRKPKGFLMFLGGIDKQHWVNNCKLIIVTQPAYTWSKLAIETLEQGVKYVQS